MLTCEGLTKSFDKPLFQDLAINLGPGQIMAILGPSGCGKTTLLRCICGLENLDHGSILLHGADVTGTPPEDRGDRHDFPRARALPSSIGVREPVPRFGVRP